MRCLLNFSLHWSSVSLGTQNLTSKVNIRLITPIISQSIYSAGNTPTGRNKCSLCASDKHSTTTNTRLAV